MKKNKVSIKEYVDKITSQCNEHNVVLINDDARLMQLYGISQTIYSQVYQAALCTFLKSVPGNPVIVGGKMYDWAILLPSTVNVNKLQARECEIILQQLGFIVNGFFIGNYDINKDMDKIIMSSIEADKNTINTELIIEVMEYERTKLYPYDVRHCAQLSDRIEALKLRL